MVSLIVSLVVLVAGFLVYGRLTEKVFSPDDRKTPAIAINDGVDCVPMKPRKAFLVQLLNIAGTGPIYGALMGACFGPVVFIWIVFGSILGGAVHDYMSGMISCRHGGSSIAELSGTYLGSAAKWIMRIFSVVLLVLTGTFFVTSPAALIVNLFKDMQPAPAPIFMNMNLWVAVILAYYVLATLLPIDKLIGKLYPVFGVLLIAMALGVLGGTIFGGYSIPEISLQNLHPEGTDMPVWPFMFVTVACGAISGFHATQSPMVAKCITSEKQGRHIFYGAMIAEAVIALIWAAAGVALYGAMNMLETYGAGSATEALNAAMSKANGGQAHAVLEISRTMLGTVGGILAVIGVVVCPITSGDTAFRSARLILGEVTHLDQKKIWKRLVITIPILAIGAVLTQLDFDILWRYFAWSNQTLAMISLWVATAYLIKKGKYRWGSVMTALPAAFMSAVSLTYILMAKKEGFGLDGSTAYPIGAGFALILLGVYVVFFFRWKKPVAVEGNA